MVKKSFGINFNKNHLTLTIIIVIILLGVYLLHLNSLKKKSDIEKFYIRENFYQEQSGKKIDLNKDTLYIYTARRKLVSCTKILKILKNDKKLPENIPIAGLPNFDFSKHEPLYGFSNYNKLPIPESAHGKLLDYVITMLTQSVENRIKYYTTDNVGSTTDPILNEEYYYNENARKKMDIKDDEFINIMVEFFKILIASNNNTTVGFIRYYKKDTARIDDEGARHFDEIDEKDLETELKNNNVIIFYENINIINFLQFSNPELAKKYEKYNNEIFKIKFEDPTGTTV